jgi:hypothetical protein
VPSCLFICPCKQGVSSKKLLQNSLESLRVVTVFKQASYQTVTKTEFESALINHNVALLHRRLA